MTNGARASMIHGGAKEWMWGWAILHAAASINRLPPPHLIPGYEGMSRLRIMDPSVTIEKEMRAHWPFLCLVFKTKPKPQLASNFNARAEPCVYLIYDTTRKSFALLTLPDLFVTYSAASRFDSCPKHSRCASPIG